MSDAAPPPARAAALRELAPGRRFLAALAAWALVAGSQPGLGRPEGFGHTAFVALAPWALFCARPGRRAFLAEWLAAALGLVATFWWMRHLLPWLVPILGLVPGLYVALGGVALRRLARRFPLALACPAAWMLGEMLRWFLPSPASFGWWRLGSFAHDSEWIVGSARTWGTWGLTWVFAAFAGWLADLWRTRGLALDEAPPFRPALVHVLGLGPLAVGMILTIVVPAPETEPGPRLLLVQPGIEQELKKFRVDPVRDLYGDAVTLTLEAIADDAEPPDLVCWGETMFPFTLVGEEVLAAVRGGAQRLPFVPATSAEEILVRRARVQALIEGVLLGRPGALGGLAGREVRLLERVPEAEWVPRGLGGEGLFPPGTSFLTGIPQWIVHDGRVRSRNAVGLWGADGRLSGIAAKTRLVPVAESSDLYAPFPFIVNLVASTGGWVPDFVAGDEVGVLTLETRAGERYAFGATVCYDNVFDTPYERPFRGGAPGVDFHLVVSNEAWYVDSVEMDHMVAFSRMQAIATGRSVARATNSGVSLVLDPSGRVVGEVVGPDGARKMARGWISAAVPVPSAGAEARTPWVRSARWQPWLWALLVAILLASSGSAVTAVAGGGNDAPGESDPASGDA